MENRIMLLSHEVDAMLVDGDIIHTYRDAGNMFIGCELERATVLEMARRHGAELSGEMATSMRHGLAVYDGKVPVFCETKQGT